MFRLKFSEPRGNMCQQMRLVAMGQVNLVMSRDRPPVKRVRTADPRQGGSPRQKLQGDVGQHQQAGGEEHHRPNMFERNICRTPTKAISGIVKYCGIALQNRDSSLVSFTDPEEVARVRNNFLKKKLGLTNSDPDLDKAIMFAADKMKGDCTKNRVTVYYLLAAHFGKLSMFN